MGTTPFLLMFLPVNTSRTRSLLQIIPTVRDTNQVVSGMVRMKRTTGSWRIMIGYDRMKREKGSGRSIISTARLLNEIIWHMRTNDEPFDPLRMTDSKVRPTAREMRAAAFNAA